MNTHSRREKPAQGRAAAAAAEEELETGEPIPEETPPPAQTPPPAGAPRIPAPGGEFVGKPWEQKGKGGGGQMVLASAKYLPKPEEKPEGKGGKAPPASKAANKEARSLEGNVFTSGMAGGLLAMVGAVIWFVVGLANDVIFFYPPILFVIGLGAFFKGMVSGRQE